MFKAIFKISEECIDIGNQEIHTPFINCYTIHSAYMFVNGIVYEQDVDFEFENHLTKWKGSFEIESRDSIILELNYFYIRNEDYRILNCITEGDAEYSQIELTNKIISKHYTEGQFSLDNGLYKNSALNFGTVLEGILNKSMTNTTLNELIVKYRGSVDKNLMHSIRVLRNKVHPNKLIETEDITRKEAIDARYNLEIILKNIT